MIFHISLITCHFNFLYIRLKNIILYIIMKILFFNKYLFKKENLKKIKLFFYIIKICVKN